MTINDLFERVADDNEHGGLENLNNLKVLFYSEINNEWILRDHMGKLLGTNPDYQELLKEWLEK